MVRQWACAQVPNLKTTGTCKEPGGLGKKTDGESRKSARIKGYKKWRSLAQSGPGSTTGNWGIGRRVCT